MKPGTGTGSERDDLRAKQYHIPPMHLTAIGAGSAGKGMILSIQLQYLIPPMHLTAIGAGSTGKVSFLPSNYNTISPRGKFRVADKVL